MVLSTKETELDLAEAYSGKGLKNPSNCCGVCFTTAWSVEVFFPLILLFCNNLRRFSLTNLLSIPPSLAVTWSQALSSSVFAPRFLADYCDWVLLILTSFSSPEESELEELDTASTLSLLRSLIIRRCSFSKRAKVAIKMRFCLLKNFTMSRSFSSKSYALLRWLRYLLSVQLR